MTRSQRAFVGCGCRVRARRTQMVVVSEEKKFVFVKTRRTGGSSVELALSGLAGRDAVVTLIMEDVDRDCRRAH